MELNITRNILTAVKDSDSDAQDTTTLHTLVVDDVESNRKMLHMLLGKCGATAATAVNGQDAIDKIILDFGSYKVVFMDNLMPVMNGPDAARHLRKIGFENLIIGVTGNVMDDDIAEYLEAGVDLVVCKPVKAALLNNILQFARKQGSKSQYPLKLFENGEQMQWLPLNNRSTPSKSSQTSPSSSPLRKPQLQPLRVQHRSMHTI
jgi:CheY-like chemotaxis protein